MVINFNEITLIKFGFGEIVNGDKQGRESDKEITVFDSTGLAVQDIVTAWNIRNKALKKGVGQKINFLE